MIMELKILSFNVWGLRICDAVHVEQRLQHIAKELTHYDIVCLQEVWERKDYIFLMTELKSVLQYSHHFTRLCLEVVWHSQTISLAVRWVLLRETNLDALH